MAITNASRLADFGSGIGTAGAVLEVDNANKRIGLGTTNPNTTVQVGAVGASGTSLFVHGDSRILGVITATTFSGSGSELTGLPGQIDLWSKTAAGINTLGSVGIGTTNPVADLTVGPVGTSGTSLFVHADARVTGIITATGFHKADGTVLGGSAGKFETTAAGINTTSSVGVGTTRPDSIARVNNTKILNVGILTSYQVYTGDAANIGGKLSVSGITSVGDVVSSGIITADSYYGDAANMTNAGISAGKAMGLAAFLS